MIWKYLRLLPWIDTRARYVSKAPKGGHLLDVATSDGETLRHMAELRPDLHFSAVDLNPVDPDKLPVGTTFSVCNVMQQDLPIKNNALDMATVMHLIEHLQATDHFFSELSRVIKPCGILYLEYPHPKTVNLPPAPKDSSGRAVYTMNFYDDLTHLEVPDTEKVVQDLKKQGFEPVGTGISRNLVFALAYLLYYRYAGKGRQKYTSKAHFLGWSEYVCLRKQSSL
jgi:ubiquinone/menaquinone biosynthesis C-methylase UbiE